MKLTLVVGTAIASLFVGSGITRGGPSPDLVTQIEAADVLSDLLTFTADRSSARVEAMHTFLREIGKDDAYNHAKPVVKKQDRLDYSQVFAAAMLFIKAGGDKFADPALKGLSESQLYEQLTAVQYYNMQQFMRYNQQRNAANSMRAYLESIDQFPAYLKWARGKVPAPDPDLAQPAPTTPQQLEERMSRMIASYQAIAWKKAQATGMSRAEFDARWKQHLAQYSESVAQKINGVKSLGTFLWQSEVAGSAPPAPEPSTPIMKGQPLMVWSNPRPNLAAPAALPTPVPARHTNADYAAKDDSLWNMWDDNFMDLPDQ
ncbi:MAG: hypothetical protein ACREJC_02165 [Tepidisphaeraceae bacterium]